MYLQFFVLPHLVVELHVQFGQLLLFELFVALALVDLLLVGGLLVLRHL